MKILPRKASTIRKRANEKVDLPAPVRPTIPIFSRGLIVQLIPRRTYREGEKGMRRKCDEEKAKVNNERMTREEKGGEKGRDRRQVRSVFQHQIAEFDFASLRPRIHRSVKDSRQTEG
jgi:hypothetical protein